MKRKKLILKSLYILLFVLIIIFIISYFQILPFFDTEGLIQMEIDKIEIIGENARVTLKARCAIINIYTSPEQISAIEEGLQNETWYRPLTHDITVDIIEGFGIDPLMVKITKIQEGTYYAELILQRWNSILILDIRPSDAIAIAVRTGMPIFVNETLVTKVC